MADFSNMSTDDLVSLLGGNNQSATDPNSFAQVYGPAAKVAGDKLGVDPSIILGQWGLETGWGKSVVPGTNNLGNIKDFSGSGVKATDNQTGSTDKYKQFATPIDFANNFVSLIQRKYPSATDAGSDANAYFSALKKGGYAEDPKYVAKGTSAATSVAKQPSFLQMLGNAAATAISGTANAAEAQPKTGNDPYKNLSTDDLIKLAGNGQSSAEPSNTDSAVPTQAGGLDSQAITPVAGGQQDPSTWQVPAQAPARNEGTGDNGFEKFLVNTGGHVVNTGAGAAALIGKGLSKIGATDTGNAITNWGQGIVKDNNATMQRFSGDSLAGKLGGVAGDVLGTAPLLLIPGVGEAGAAASRIVPAGEGLLSAAVRGGVSGAVDGAVQGGAQGAANAAGEGQDVWEGTKTGAGTGAAVGGLLGSIISPAANLLARNATNKAADQAAAQALAGVDTREAALGGKISDAVDNLSADSNGAFGTTADEIARLRANADSAVPGIQRTAADATNNPAIASLQQGLLNSEYKAPLVGQDIGNTKAGYNFLNQGATSEDALAAAQREFEANQANLYHAGANELPPVSPQEAGGLFQQPQMQQAVNRANSIAQNDGSRVIQNQIDRNNAANVQAFQGISERPQDLQHAIQTRGNAAGQLYDQAVGANAPRLTVDPQLHDLLHTPAGASALRVAENARANAQLPGDVLQTSPTGVTTIHPRDVQVIKQALDDLIEPNPLSSISKTERTGIMNVKNGVNDWLGNAVPAYGQANDVFRQMTPRVQELSLLQDANVTDKLGNLNLGSIDSLIKRIEADQAGNDITAAGRSVSAAKLDQLRALRDHLQNFQGVTNAQGVAGHGFEYLRQAGTDTAGNVNPAVQNYLTRTDANGQPLAPSYHRAFQEQAAGNQALAQQGNFNQIIRKIDSRSYHPETGPQVNANDLKPAYLNPNQYSAENLARINAVHDDVTRAANRYEKVPGSNTASNLSSAKNFSNFIAPPAPAGLRKYVDGQTIANGAAALAGNFAGGGLGQYAAGHVIKGVTDKMAANAAEKLAAETAKNAEALTNLITNPKHLADVLEKIGASKAEKAAVKNVLINKILDYEKNVSKAGGLLGGVVGKEQTQ